MHAPQIDKADCDLVRNSGFFDADWYLKRYSDVALIGMDPVEHFVWLGWRLGRDPGPKFSTEAYLQANPDIKAAGMNALLHFLQHGIAEGRRVRQGQHKLSAKPGNGKRVAIFASFSAKGIVEDYVKIYLKALSSVAEHIVFVADNEVTQPDKDWLSQHVDASIFGRHGEYDFGSYKRGIAQAFDSGILDDASELILCNDSCYGPLSNLSHAFHKMEPRNLDFWGITQNAQFGDHIQSYFVVFKRNVFSDVRFKDFFDGVTAKDHVSKVVMTYEVPMTSHFEKMGFKWGTIVDKSDPRYSEVCSLDPNMTRWPMYMIEAGSPFVKVKAFKVTNCNFDGIARTLDYVSAVDPILYNAIFKHVDPAKYFKARDLQFSLIMPFYNRSTKIQRAIDSVLGQRHQNFELIAVDDGSTDGGSEMIAQHYKDEIQAGRLRLVKLATQQGVSAARNAGLAAARHAWIGYVDSDNTVDPCFLEIFASSIIEHPEKQTFYAWLRRVSDKKVVGSHYSRKKLIDANFIDLGAFVHSKEVYKRNGGFDKNLKRLVDWDLIIRYTEKYVPVCIPRPVVEYDDDSNDTSRISIRVPFDNARIAIRKKFRMPFRVSTIVPTYNHKDFVEKAVESALAQKGHIQQEILLCDDGSNDGTAEIVAKLASRYPNVIRNISNKSNIGISENFKNSISRASGDFIAILEGDDIWTDNEKLHKQSQFLADNTDCSMVFSKILVRSLITGNDQILERQRNLTTGKLDGADFLAEPTMNLIANFSSCMFKGDLLRRAPLRLFHGRFNEIALAFYMERQGKIGFLDEVMSVYHQHANGVWTGSSKKEQLKSGLETRRMVLDVADPRYAEPIRRIIRDRFEMPLSELAGT